MNDSKLVLSIYNDVASPAMKQIGQSAEGLLKLVALPFKFLGLTAEEIEKKYTIFIQKAINRVPQEKLTLPKSSIAAPLLDYVKFCFVDEPGNDLLQEMFSKLLSSTINADYVCCFQKSFIEIMRFLSGNEAKLLQWYADVILDESVEKELIGGAYISSFSFWENGRKTYEISATTPGSFSYVNFPVEESLTLLSSLGLISIEQEESYPGFGFFDDLISLKNKDKLNFEIPSLFDEAISYVLNYEGEIFYRRKKDRGDTLLQLLLKSEILQLYNILSQNQDISAKQLVDMKCFRSCVSITTYGAQFLSCCT